jgi:hypothetical protein
MTGTLALPFFRSKRQFGHLISSEKMERADARYWDKIDKKPRSGVPERGLKTN